jgi:hypothetical protein
MPLIIILLRPFFKFFVISPLLDALVRLKIIFLISPTDVDDDDDDDVVDADSNDQEEHNYLNKFWIFRKKNSPAAATTACPFSSLNLAAATNCSALNFSFGQCLYSFKISNEHVYAM